MNRKRPNPDEGPEHTPSIEEIVAEQVDKELKRCLEHAAEGLHWIGADGSILWANQTELNLLGYSADEYIGHNVAEFHVDQPVIEDILDRLNRGETLLSYEARLRHKDGSIRHVQINSNVLRRDGEFLRTQCFTRDVTDRKASDDLALRVAHDRKRIEARNRFLVHLDDRTRPLTDAEEITFTAAKALGQHLHVNRCAYATVEDDEDTFVLTGNYNHGVHSIVGRYTFRQFGEECLRLMRAGEPYVVADSESDPRVTDAERPSYRTTAIRAVICVPILKRGRFVAAMAVHTAQPRSWRPDEAELVQQVASRCWESIERARVTQEVKLQKRLLYSLFMQAPTLIAVLKGPTHVVELANPPVCQIWGRTQEELLNRPLFDVLPELRDQGFQSRLDGVYTTGDPYVGVEAPATFNRAGGATETVYFNYVFSPYRRIEGHIEGIFIIASDVTEQVLARNQINQLREAAEAANRAKDEFLAMLGHELRNPLSPILTALQLMKLRGSDGFERERTVLERQVNHLTRLVDDLLDVSRIARGKVELKAEIIEMTEVVAKAIEMSSPLLEQRAHTLMVDVPERGLAIEGDPTRLSQVISNLLTNAAKYTPPGGHIDVLAGEQNGEIVLRVRDTGIGIAPEVLPRVFDLFVQERQAIDRSQGGLGLGLTIVRNLVERHGGSVSAHSDGPGRGSEFVVRLPQSEAARAILEAPPSAHIEPASAPAGACRILVVDDNEDAADVLAELLATRGYRTRVAHDAPAALRLAEELTPDIAFLDIGLPVMDGYELAARLREIPALLGIRLIALTGYGQESDRRKTRAAGFHHHLVKPVDISALEKIVHACLAQP